MNVKTTIATMSLLSALSFGAFAAESINAEQAQNLQSIGTVSVSAITASPSDIRDALSQKADQQGATAYRVIEVSDNNSWHATAELYK